MKTCHLRNLLKLGFAGTCCGLASCAIASPVWSQIVPDNTLPINSVMTPSGAIFAIDGGTVAGNNLFHSFSQFSVPVNAIALFNTNQNTIITRVTGGLSSQIDGAIAAPNSTLFFLNPNGIVFGPNARLSLGGSFIASTASSLRFADGSEFSATNPQSLPLLSVSAPIGLQFGPNPGSIVNQSRVSSLGLTVLPGQTLSLIGGNITFSGGLLSATQSRLELGSVGENSFVGLTLAGNFWIADYSQVTQFADIELTRQATLITAGNGGGDIQIQGRKVSMREGAQLNSFTFGTQAGGSIRVNASERFKIVGTGFEDFERNFIIGGLTGTVGLSVPGTGLFAGTTGPSAAGQIEIDTPQFILENGAVITTPTFTSGRGGDLLVRATELLQVDASGLLSITTRGSSGEAGNILIDAGNVVLQNGGLLLTTTLGRGRGGNLIVRASESVIVPNIRPGALLASGLATVTVLGTGRAGDLTIETKKLTVQGGGTISTGSGATTLSSPLILGGPGGNLRVTASESVELNGTSPDGRFASTLESQTRGNSPAGNLTIVTPELIVRDRAAVSVSSFSSGNAGSLNIFANAIRLERGGRLTAATASGEGGNINLQVRDLLLLRNNSLLSAEAGKTGNGGNIAINAPLVVAIPTENSDIIANAFEGQGGNIEIATQGIFGLEFREQLTPLSDINASSEFGVSGTVTITRPEVDPGSEIAKLPENITDPAEQIIARCPTDEGSSFAIAGRGGLPEDPTVLVRGQTVWRDLQDFSTAESESQAFSPPSVPARKLPNPKQIVEATGWVMNRRGNIELVAIAPNATSTSPGSKSADCSDL